MAIASDFLIWQENGRVLCRVMTNADMDKLRTRLAFVGLSHAVEDIRAYFGDRLNGGSGYELMFTMQVSRSEVRRRIVKL